MLNTFSGGIPFGKDRYECLRLGYTVDRRDPDGRWILQPALTQGLGGNPAADPLSSRLGASGVFTKFNYDGVRVQIVDDQAYLIGRLSGQLAASPLFVSEEFALGGSDSVRGFAQSEFLGDYGYSLSGEVNFSPLPEDPQLLQLAAFVDHGSARRRDPQPGEDPSRTLTGMGLGLRMRQSGLVLLENSAAT